MLGTSLWKDSRAGSDKSEQYPPDSGRGRSTAWLEPVCLAAVTLPVPTRPAGTPPVPGLLGRQQLPCSALISTPGTFSTTLKSWGRAGSRPHPSLLMNNFLRKIGKAVN